MGTSGLTTVLDQILEAAPNRLRPAVVQPPRGIGPQQLLDAVPCHLLEAVPIAEVEAVPGICRESSQAR